MEDLRFPIGRFTFSSGLTESARAALIDEIAAAPERLRKAAAGLDEAQLETPYRPEGWTLRQVIHHLPDSHMNSFIRFKLALTEDEPTIKPYNENAWSQLPDASRAPVETSFALLESLHARWVMLLRSLTEQDLQRNFRHPELGLVSLEKNLALYAWHGNHHIAHIENLRTRMGW